MGVEKVLIIGSGLLLASIGSSKVSNKMGVPVLLFFLLIGTLLGQYLGITPTWGSTETWAMETVQGLGIVTLVLVLFSGGLETDFEHMRPIMRSGILLSTLGALVTALLVGLFLRWSTVGTLNLSLTEGFLVGAIVASTDAAAVFSILRARNIQLKANLGHLLELESGSNDVMVFFLMGFFLHILEDAKVGFWGMLLGVMPLFFQEMVLGFLGGLLMGYVMVTTINKINLRFPGLYPALTLSLLCLTYAVTNSLHGSGFLAVYICGMIVGNQDVLHKKSLIDFYKGVGWLMQITMFIALGLLATPREMGQVVGLGLKLSIVLMVVARPLSVFLALASSDLKWRHKVFVSWVGLRGAVPIVFATYLHGLDKDKAFFHLIFFVVIVSVLLQGTTLHPLAKWLKLENKVVKARKEKQIAQRSDAVKKMLIQLEVPPESIAHEREIVKLGLPEGVRIAVIHRAKEYLQPRGDTRVQAGDRLVVMLDTKKDLKTLKGCLGIR